MPVQIEISEKYLDDLIAFYQQKQRDLHQRGIEIEIEISELNKMIAQLKNSNGKVFSTEIENFPFTEPYLDKWPWARKIKFALGSEKKPLTTKEIVDILCKYEPSLINDRKKVVASISATLSVKSVTRIGIDLGETGEFVREDGETGDYVYSIYQIQDLSRAAASHITSKHEYNMRDYNSAALNLQEVLKEVKLPF
jgi:hypothetical protein